MEAAIGADIGGTKIRFALVDRNGRLLRRESVATEARLGAAQVLEKTLSGTGRMLETAKTLTGISGGPPSVAGIGIGSAGQIDFRTGAVAYAVDTLPGWTGTPIRQAAERRFGLPVCVDNDVNAIAIAERLYGAGRHLRSFVCLALGTGIGGAVFEAGRLVRGAFGGAGELGHVSIDCGGPRCSCGNYGCVELYASGSGIARLAAESAAAGGFNAAAWGSGARGVIAGWLAGDAAAAQVMALAIRALGTAVSGYIHAFNPEAVIIGGGVAEAGGPFFRALEAEVNDRTSSRMREACRILPAYIGSDAGVIGAAGQVWLCREAGAADSSA
ncbi:ROK family protein [Paenibacillus humicola]|uniref:ROK family protein n=1 Tax=Paenibacillus humicola TaxID=3110540 RepID=UPI00237BA450|nr:ROK family protein [Paenibacillus humicola]